MNIRNTVEPLLEDTPLPSIMDTYWIPNITHILYIVPQQASTSKALPVEYLLYSTGSSHFLGNIDIALGDQGNIDIAQEIMWITEWSHDYHVAKMITNGDLPSQKKRKEWRLWANLTKKLMQPAKR